LQITVYVAILFQDFVLVYVPACRPWVPNHSVLHP
jgi:hypothetical protein